MKMKNAFPRIVFFCLLFLTPLNFKKTRLGCPDNKNPALIQTELFTTSRQNFLNTTQPVPQQPSSSSPYSFKPIPIDSPHFVKLLDSSKQNKGIVFLDTRDMHQSLYGYIKGSYLIPSNLDYDEWVTALFSSDQRFVLITDKDNVNDSYIRQYRVGYKDIIGYIDYDTLHDYLIENNQAKYLASSSVIFQEKLKEFIEKMGKNVLIIDVRAPCECDKTGVIRNAVEIPLEQLEDRIGEVIILREARPVAVYCRSGGRAAIAESILERHGIDNIYHLGGIMNLLHADFVEKIHDKNSTTGQNLKK